MKKISILILILLLTSCVIADDMIWPDSVNAIDQQAFDEDHGTGRIIIPPSVKVIESHAFAGSSIKAITLPGHVQIAPDAFEGCGPLEVNTPSGSPTAVFAGEHLQLVERKYDSGTYEVGRDLPANVYIIRAHSGKTATLILSGRDLQLTRSFTGNLILRLMEGETLTLKSAYAVVDYEFDQHEALHASGSQGMLRVGKDIPEGKHYLRLDGASGTLTWYADDRMQVSKSQQIDSSWLQKNNPIQLAAGDLIGYDGLLFLKGDGKVERRALLIGQSYAGSAAMPPLKGTIPDATSMKAMLCSMKTPFACTLRSDLTASAILSSVKSVFADADEDDVSLFYYSGHGEAGGLLVGQNGQTIRPASLRAAMDTIPGEKILIVDCCYSGGLLGQNKMLFASSNGVPNPPSDPADPSAFVASFNSAFGQVFSFNNSGEYFDETPYYVLTACAANELSYEKYYPLYDRTVGMFTYYFSEGCGWDSLRMEALVSCAADNDKDGQLTIKELYGYSHQKVAYLNTPTDQTVSCFPVGSTHVLFIP